MNRFNKSGESMGVKRNIVEYSDIVHARTR